MFSLEQMHQSIPVTAIDALPPKQPRAPNQLDIEAPNIFFVAAAWRNTTDLSGCCNKNVGVLARQEIDSLVGPMWTQMPLFD